MQKQDLIQQIIKSYHSVSINSMETLLNHIEFKHIPKGEVFVKKDGFNEFEYFLLNGVCRSYVLNHNGEEITLSFFQDKTILTPNIARTLKNTSTLNFQAITDIEIGRFKAIELVKLMQEFSEMRSFANAVLQQELISKSNKELFNASLTAKERLIQFRTQFKALENHVPHPAIASYLGITNISLSRLRKELAME